MISERYMPLNKAARILGVTSKTARKWFERDCGLVFKAARFQRTLVSETDVQRVIDCRTGVRNWSVRKAS